MTKVKYTKEVLAPIVAVSKCVREVVLSLGGNPGTGTQGYIAQLIKKFNIDTSHFLGSGWSAGVRVSKKKRTPEQILVVRDISKQPESTYLLKRALIESGVEYKCSECGQLDTHQGKPLVIQIDHVDGRKHDCRLQNLRFLCPNCHSQTETYGYKKRNPSIGTIT